MQLRPYIEPAASELLVRLMKHRRVVGVAPTGAGKTAIGAALVRATGPRARVLWLAHRHQLLKQARERLVGSGLSESEVGMLSGVEKVHTSARVIVASVGMFRSRDLPPVDLIIVDEAHHVAAAGYRNILAEVPDVPLLGLTATPWRLDGKPLGDCFEHLFVVAESMELIADGYIMESIVFGIPRKAARDMVVGLGDSSGDYSIRRLEERVRRQPLMADIVQEWQRLANGLPTIAYACTIAHAIDLRDRFKQAGVEAETLDWSTPESERAAVLERLANGATKVVVNVEILTEGVDCPAVKCIVVARPTRSLTLHRQMCGRASRPTGNGQRPLILDHAGNTWRLGLPEMPVEWSLTERASVGAGGAPVKRCDACGAMNGIGALECAECGAAFEVAARDLKERAGELERVDVAKTERERVIRNLAAARGLDESWVKRALGSAA